MTYVKWFFITFVFSLGLGFGLAYLQADKEYETTIDVASNETKKNLVNATVRTYPKVEMKYNAYLTGDGKFIFQSEKYSPIFMIISAPGYETKKGFWLLKADEPQKIYLNPLHEESEDVDSEGPKTNKEEPPEKVDLLPNLKETKSK